MKKEIAKQWVTALRSGNYKQGKKALCRVQGKDVRYCCLGVLCHILGTPYEKKGQLKNYGNVDEVLPKSVIEKVEIKNSEGKFITYPSGKNEYLTCLNDSGKSFKEIADIIEENWEQL